MPDATGPLSLPPTKPCPSPSVQYTTAGDLCLAPQAANAPPPATRFLPSVHQLLEEHFATTNPGHHESPCLTPPRPVALAERATIIKT